MPIIILFAGCSFPIFSGGKLEDSGAAVHVDKKGIAAKGADVVAYFTLDPDELYVTGLEEYSMEWKNATWLFSNQENLDAFASNPDIYAPKYGGYCSWAMARNKLATIDPDMWAIVVGELYLNYDSKTHKDWAGERSQNIEDADANWPDWKEKLTSDG